MSYEYASFTEPRQIRLLKAFIDKAQSDKIQSISYVWGSREKPYSVWCDGLSIGVTASAMSVLRMAASNENIEYIWIDALSINQNNNAEKAVQVRLMRDVYPAARRTIAWLGEATPSINEAMDFIVTLHTALKTFESRGIPHVTGASLTSVEGCQLFSSGWEALGCLLEHPWFSRIWILQEMVLGTQIDIVYDDRTVPWSLLEYVAYELTRNGLKGLVPASERGKQSDRSRGFHTIFMAWSFRRTPIIDPAITTEPIKLASLLASAPFILDASYDRDNLFGLLGMAQDVNDFTLEPDYEATPTEVFLKWTAGLLTRDHSSNVVLHCAGIGLERQLTDLPSWVPDWTKPRRSSVLGVLASSACYGASGSQVPVMKTVYDEDKRSITLSGYVIDDVTKYASSLSTRQYQESFGERSDFILMVDAWLDGPKTLIDSNVLHPMGLPYYPDILWRTLVAGMDWYGDQASTSFQNDFEDFVTLVEHLRNPEVPWTDEIPDSVDKFMVAASNTVYDRRVFATRLGYLGLGPSGIEAGDKICVILGFTTPFIVRPKEDDRYLLVGECYIYGLMNGEALDGGILEDINLY